MVRGLLVARCACALRRSAASPRSGAERPRRTPSDGRFSFHQAWMTATCGSTRRTGQVSMCNRQSSAGPAQPVPDERVALEDEIARLQTENAALKKELLARGLPLPGAVEARAAGGAQERASRELKLPERRRSRADDDLHRKGLAPAGRDDASTSQQDMHEEDLTDAAWSHEQAARLRSPERRPESSRPRR